METSAWMAVVSSLAWPSRCWMKWMSAPHSSLWVAQETMLPLAGFTLGFHHQLTVFDDQKRDGFVDFKVEHSGELE